MSANTYTFTCIGSDAAALARLLALLQVAMQAPDAALPEPLDRFFEYWDDPVVMSASLLGITLRCTVDTSAHDPLEKPQVLAWHASGAEYLRVHVFNSQVGESATTYYHAGKRITAKAFPKPVLSEGERLYELVLEAKDGALAKEVKAGASPNVFLTPLAPIWSLLTVDNLVAALSLETNIRAIVNTLLIALGGAFIATAFISILTLVTHRSDFRFRRQLEYVSLFPRAVPGLIAGIGFFYAMVLIPPMGWLRNSVWILILAYLMRYIPTGFGAMSPTAMQIAPDLDRSARVMGGDWWTACRNAILPLMRPAIFTSFALLFIHFLKEYSIAIFLVAPGSEIIGTTLLQYWVLGDMGTLAALATVQVVITVVFIYVVRKFLKVNIYG